MNELTKESVYKEAVSILEDMQYEASFYPDYSGRGMYGKTVHGISTKENGSIVGYAVTAACYYLNPDINDPYEVFEFIPKNSDSLGLGMIYY